MRKLVPLALAITAGAVFGASHGSPTRAQTDEAGVPLSYRKLVQHLAAQEGREHYRSVHDLDSRGLEELKSKGIYPKLTRGNPKMKTVALTFDDGPYVGDTLKLLEVLKKAGIRATMFNVGYKCAQHPELVRAELAAGHEVANHTYMHISLGGRPAPLVENELVYGANVIRKIGGLDHVVDICRPRGGGYDDTVVNVAHKHGFTIALWTDDPGDYNNLTAAQIERSLLQHLDPGGIVLLHDSLPETRKALPSFIAEAKRRGYRFVTCSEMMREPGCVTWGGPNTYKQKP